MRCSILFTYLICLLASCTSATSGNPSAPAEAPVAQAAAAEAPAAEVPVAPAQVVPAQPSAQAPGLAQPASTEHFELEWNRGSGAMFRDRISIRDDGHFKWVAQEITGSTGVMHAIDVQLTDAEVRAVRQAIDSADFFSLPAEPAPSGIADGEQLTLRLRYGDSAHEIRVEQPLPAGVRRIQQAIQSLFTEARRAQLRTAGPPQPGALSLRPAAAGLTAQPVSDTPTATPRTGIDDALRTR